jgi:hypothetical protein
MPHCGHRLQPVARSGWFDISHSPASVTVAELPTAVFAQYTSFNRCHFRLGGTASSALQLRSALCHKFIATSGGTARVGKSTIAGAEFA